MDNQANLVEDASRDDSRVANSRSANMSAGSYSPLAVTSTRRSDVQESSTIRIPSYSHAVPVVTAAEATQCIYPNGQPPSNPAATRHDPIPKAVTTGRESTPNVLIGSQDRLANRHTPARSSQTEYARPSQPQRSSPPSASAPSRAPHIGKKPSSTSATFPVTLSEETRTGNSKNVPKQSFDHKNDGHSSRKRRRGSANGVSNQSTAVQADERERWDDARFDPPKDRDEMEALQEALAPTFRTFATISGRPSPEVSPWNPYGYQYRILQKAMLEAWKSDRRLNDAPMLAGLCAWPGGIMAWHEARVHTSEEDLLAYTHPSLLAPQIRPGSLLWYQDFAREWFHGDEEDRRRQDAIQSEVVQGDLEQRQATQARTQVEAVSTQVRPGPPVRRRAAPAIPRKRAINAQARPNTEAQGQPVADARIWGEEDATQPRAVTSVPKQATPITLHKTAIEAHALAISRDSGKDATEAGRGEGMRPQEERTVQADTRHQETVHKEEGANQEEPRNREGKPAGQPTGHTHIQSQAPEKAFQASTREEGFLVRVMSDSVIAQHPKAFRNFLLQYGFRHYMSGTQPSMSWEAWCTGFALPLFERAVAHHHTTVSRDSSSPSATAVAMNGSSPSVRVFRCTITLEQARLHHDQRLAANAETESGQTDRVRA